MWPYLFTGENSLGQEDWIRSMKLYKILIYLGVLLALVAYIYFVEIKHKQAETERKEKESRIVQLDRDQINDVKIVRHDEKAIDIKKSDSKGWNIISPVNTLADTKAVEDLLVASTLAQPEKTVLEKGVNWKDYGLDKPDLELILTGPGKNVTICFGASNPSKSSYYLKVEGEPRLLLVPDTLRISLNKTLFDLRDKSVAKFSPGRIDKIEIVKDGQETDLEQKEGKWRILKPVSAPAKSASVRTLLRSLEALKAKEILDEPPNANNPYNLNESKNSITLTGKDFKKTLTLGSIKDKKSGGGQSGNSVYMSVSGEAPVYVVDDRFFSGAKLDPESLTDRSIVSIEPRIVEKILIEFMGKNWELARASDNKWKMEQPERRDKLEDWLVSEMLWSLKDLNYKSVISPIPDDLAPYQLNLPQLVMSIYEKGAKDPVKITMGWPASEEPSSNAGAQSRADHAIPPESDNKNPSQGLDAPKVPKIAYAVVEPPNDEKHVIYIVDGAFIGKLRVDLDQLLKKE